MSGLRNIRNAVLAATVFALAVGGLCHGAAESARRGGILGSVPGESLFCVRIAGLEGTLDAANEFLKGVAPEPFDAKTAAFSKLGSLLGNEKLPGVNRKGGIAVFGVEIPSDEPARGPMGNIFLGALVSVNKYENFISRNPNCGQPDAEGISTITADGKPRALVVNVGRFALLCPPDARDKLLGVRKLIPLGAGAQRKRSLQRSLDEDERKMAAASPVLLYLNVKAGSKLVEPMVAGKLGQIKAQLQKMKEEGQGPAMVDPSAVIGLYAGIFKMLMGGTDHIMVGLSPTSEMCNVTVGVKAVPGTDFAATIGSPLEGDFGDMLGYLDDGAIMNMTGKVDRASLKSAYVKLIELMGTMAPGAVSTADMEGIKKLTVKAIDAMGESLAISFGPTGTSSPAIAIKYVIKIGDEKAFRDVIEEQLKMMRDGAFGKLYKGFGMDLSFKVERDNETYKGVRIDTAKVDFDFGDDALMQTEVIEKIYGDTLDYRWAFVDGYCVYSIGGGADKGIRELIDQVRAGGPKQVGSEMKAAMNTLADSGQADVVGAFNYVRMLNMVTSFMPVPAGESRPKLEVPTQSSIAFSGRTVADGKMTLQMSLPKKHLMEIKAAFETLIPQIKKQEELQRQKRKDRSNDA
ncbi:MAG: hypothetical protein ABIF19_17725 [Planctomycetota bacterium]